MTRVEARRFSMVLSISCSVLGFCNGLTEFAYSASFLAALFVLAPLSVAVWFSFRGD